MRSALRNLLRTDVQRFTHFGRREQQNRGIHTTLRFSKQRLCFNRKAGIADAQGAPNSGCLQSVLCSRLSTEVKYLYNIREEQLDGVPDIVKQALSLQTANRPSLNKASIQAAIKKFQRFPSDTGSSEVQVAVLTEKINYMTEHLQKHTKDNVSKRSLQAMLVKRRKMLKHLRKNNFETFKKVLYELNLRDII